MQRVFFRKMAIMAIAVVTMSLAANAQEKGDKAVGASIVLGTGNYAKSGYTNIGVSGKFQYNILDRVRAEGALTYFLKKKYMNMWDVSFNGHYLFPINENMIVYPLAGVGVFGYQLSSNISGTRTWNSDPDVCVNLGGGIDIKLTDNLIVNAEAKYKIVEHWNRLVLSAGIAFMF